MLDVPLYVAETVVVPAGNSEVVRVALPPARLAVPSVIVPAVNAIVPPSTTIGDSTIALNFTFCPRIERVGRRSDYHRGLRRIDNLAEIIRSALADQGVTIVRGPYPVSPCGKLALKKNVAVPFTSGTCGLGRRFAADVSCHRDESPVSRRRLLPPAQRRTSAHQPESDWENQHLR
jgi:hypothetical protein